MKSNSALTLTLSAGGGNGRCELPLIRKPIKPKPVAILPGSWECFSHSAPLDVGERAGVR